MPKVINTSARVKAALPPLPNPLPRGAREQVSLRPYANPLSLRGRGYNSWSLLGFTAPRIKRQRSQSHRKLDVSADSCSTLAPLVPLLGLLSLREARELVSATLATCVAPSNPLLTGVTRLPPPRELFSNLVSSKILQYLFRHLYFNIFL